MSNTSSAKLEIQLLNGVWMDAIQVSEGIFQVQTAKGIKLYGLDRIRNMRVNGEIIPVGSIPVVNKKEEGAMSFLAHWVCTNDGLRTRVITNYFRDFTPDPKHPAKVGEEDSYWGSIDTRRPCGNFMAVNLGKARFHELEARIQAAGNPKFRVTIVKNKAMKVPTMNAWAAKSTFMWVNAGSTFFMKIDGDVGTWSLDLLDIFMTYSKKTSKRQQEILRSTELGLVVDDPNDIDIEVNDFGLEEMLVDGVFSISVEFYKRIVWFSAHDGYRRRQFMDDMPVMKMARIVGPWGVIKGNCYVNTKQIADVVTASCNIKREMYTGDHAIVTIWDHAPHHLAIYDDQSILNARPVFSEQAQRADLEAVVTLIKSNLANGVLPEWLSYDGSGRTDSGAPIIANLQGQLSKNYQRWIAAGLDIEAAQFIVYMAINGYILEMIRHRKETTGYDGRKMVTYKKTFVPMRNAFTGGVITWSAAKYVCGLDFPDEDGSRVFWDNRVGLVIPDHRFMETFNLHGTWDLDDTVKCVLVDLFCEDPDVVAIHKTWGSIPAEMDVPSDMAEALRCVAFVRSPNGPGEFSFELISDIEDMPWHEYTSEAIQVVNLAHMSLPQGALLAGVNKTGLPPDASYTGARITKADSVRMMQAQQDNPGVGAFANIIMAWTNVFGPSFPDTMLDVMGEIIDALQQGASQVQFDAINDEIIRLNTLLGTKMLADPTLKIDRQIARVRFNNPEITRELNKTGQIVSGRFSRFVAKYEEVVQELSDEIRKSCMARRQRTDIVRWAMGLNFSQPAMDWAKGFYDAFEDGMAVILDAYKTPADADPFFKMTLEYEKHDAMRKLVDTFIAELESYGDMTHQRVLALWHYIVTPKARTRFTREQKYGLYDRIIFQPGTTTCIMDLLIEALVERGMAHPLGS